VPKLISNKLYTDLCTGFAIAEKKDSEAHLAVRQALDRIETLEARTRKLETEQKQLGLEWEELYDKVRKAMARVSKRAERAEKLEPGPDPELNGPEAPEGAEPFIDPISKRILAMRGRGRV